MGIVTLLLSFHPRPREKVEKELPKKLEKNGVNDKEGIKQALSTALLKLGTAWNERLNYTGYGPTVLHLAVEGHHADIVETDKIGTGCNYIATGHQSNRTNA